MTISFIMADYQNQQHGNDVLYLLNAYAEDAMGGGAPLSAQVIEQLLPTLAKRHDVFSLICYVDEQPAGLINFIEGFSTFLCQPLMNIHDVVVLTPYRGLGLSGKMMEQVAEFATARGCCKLTLEVLEGNKSAQQAYLKFGFAGYQLDPAMGKALFWEKKLK
jgi:GNAT superfamily N-acetyltransferase